MTGDPVERYVRHARRFGIEGLKEAAVSDLDDRQLERLRRQLLDELGIRVAFRKIRPKSHLSTGRKRSKSAAASTGRTPPESVASGRTCLICGKGSGAALARQDVLAEVPGRFTDRPLPHGPEGDRAGRVADGGGFEGNIPDRALRELAHIVGRYPEDEMRISVAESRHVVFEISDAVFSSSLITGQFPNYRQLLPEEFEDELRVGAEFADVRRVAPLATGYAVLWPELPRGRGHGLGVYPEDCR